MRGGRVGTCRRRPRMIGIGAARSVPRGATTMRGARRGLMSRPATCGAGPTIRGGRRCARAGNAVRTSHPAAIPSVICTGRWSGPLPIARARATANTAVATSAKARRERVARCRDRPGEWRGRMRAVPLIVLPAGVAWPADTFRRRSDPTRWRAGGRNAASDRYRRSRPRGCYRSGRRRRSGTAVASRWRV